MATLRMHALRQPVQLERLLETFLTRASILPEDAYRIRDPEALPDALQRVIFNAAQEDRIWMSWAHRQSTWLFTCEKPLASPGDRVLHVNVYDKNGELMEAGAWAPDATGKWERCAA